MLIEEFQVVLRAKNFDETCRFYGVTLGLPLIRTWENSSGRGAHYHAGYGIIAVLGRPSEATGRDERFDYQGPDQKMTVTLTVPSAEQAYEEVLYRQKNIPGGLEHNGDGRLVFRTHDPDGVTILLRDRDRGE